MRKTSLPLKRTADKSLPTCRPNLPVGEGDAFPCVWRFSRADGQSLIAPSGPKSPENGAEARMGGGQREGGLEVLA